MGLFEKNKNSDDIADILETINALNSRIDELENQNRTYNERFSRMQNKIDELEINNNILKSIIDEQVKTVTEKSSVMSSEVPKDSEAFSARITELEKQMSLICGIEYSEKVSQYLSKLKQALKVSELLSDISGNSDFVSDVNKAQDLNVNSKYGFENVKEAEKFKEQSDNKFEAEIKKLDKIISLPQGDETNYKYTEVSDGICIESYNGFDEKTVVIPSEINGIPVVEIGNEAFYNCKAVKNIVLPNTLKRIGLSAFYGTSLEQLKIPDGTETIERNAFNVHTLIHICVPDSVIKISDEVFFSSFYGRNITFYCNSGSYAMKYARKHRIRTLPYNEYDMLL